MIELTPDQCYMTCDCQCGKADRHFDVVAARELRNPKRLDDVCRQNVGWYCDKSLGEESVGRWPFMGRSGLYFLWHKDDYCAQHERFHMKALYVGKGAFSARIRSHFWAKDTSEQMLVYFTFAEMPNRLAKYTEQLLLDLYKLPLNKTENPGQGRLCAHFTQNEVD
jgi:hypothetical protein